MSEPKPLRPGDRVRWRGTKRSYPELEQGDYGVVDTVDYEQNAPYQVVFVRTGHLYDCTRRDVSMARSTESPSAHGDAQ